ncbi:hypothetical protein [Asticcacaulis sp. YBE204]|uniref:hypothetical protein n=1 Tax=Asticcacaulis sp. YBE204 TaxID=1282363 RepID=UPI0003C3BF90|nr:hypothetical protein [Asticcacaulis sp. YBE204]ESQ79176.1 hypothetical protein AEYBE204_09205 [Asticcacaulis sp. YBE204]
MKADKFDLNRACLYLAIILALVIAASFRYELKIKASGVEFRPVHAGQVEKAPD